MNVMAAMHRINVMAAMTDVEKCISRRLNNNNSCLLKTQRRKYVFNLM